MNLKGKTIAVIGLGYVGLPLAVEYGKNRPVIGFDIKSDRIAELKDGYDHTLEVEAEDLGAASELTFTDDSALLSKAQIFIVTVPTPVDKANRPDLSPLVKASETVGKVLKVGDIVIYESTVYPGATEEVCVPILERQSKLTFNKDFFVGYSPERINPGDKTHRLPDIKKVTSGSTPEIAEAIDALYQEIVTAGTHKASSIKVAEAAKVIENAQRDLNIAFVNELAVIFNRMEIDTTEVLAAAATKWNFLSFKPGLVGGHCIGVDPYYLTYKAQVLGYQPEVIQSGRRINDSMGVYAARNLVRLMINNKINVADALVGIMGITFKENCPDVRNSRVFDILRELRHWGLDVRLFDPLARAEEVSREHGFEMSDIKHTDCLDAIIVAVAHEDYVRMTPKNLRELCSKQSRPVVADLKAVYDRRTLEAQGFSVFRF